MASERLTIRAEHLPYIEKYFGFGGCILWNGRGVAKRQIIKFEIDRERYNDEDFGTVWVAFPSHIKCVKMPMSAWDEFEIEWRIPIPDDIGLSWI